MCAGGIGSAAHSTSTGMLPDQHGRIIGTHNAAEAVEEHAAIYRAIRDGDADAAAHAATVHLDNKLEDYRRDIRRRVFGGAGRPDGTVAP